MHIYKVIISSAVWDVRKSFKLLRWCPSLDQMHTLYIYILRVCVYDIYIYRYRYRYIYIYII